MATIINLASKDVARFLYSVTYEKPGIYFQLRTSVECFYRESEIAETIRRRSALEASPRTS
jgi:hypothetical protein